MLTSTLFTSDSWICSTADTTTTEVTSFQFCESEDKCNMTLDKAWTDLSLRSKECIQSKELESQDQEVPQGSISSSQWAVVDLVQQLLLTNSNSRHLSRIILPSWECSSKKWNKKWRWRSSNYSWRNRRENRKWGWDSSKWRWRSREDFKSLQQGRQWSRKRRDASNW